jgi:5'-3' exonuclease
MKIIGGLLTLSLGVWIFLWNKKSSKHDRYPDDVHDDLVGKSIDFQGYLLSIILFLSGIGLIISAVS